MKRPSEASPWVGIPADAIERGFTLGNAGLEADMARLWTPLLFSWLGLAPSERSAAHTMRINGQEMIWIPWSTLASISGMAVARMQRAMRALSKRHWIRRHETPDRTDGAWITICGVRAADRPSEHESAWIPLFRSFFRAWRMERSMVANRVHLMCICEIFRGRPNPHMLKGVEWRLRPMQLAQIAERAGISRSSVRSAFDRLSGQMQQARSGRSPVLVLHRLSEIERRQRDDLPHGPCWQVIVIDAKGAVYKTRRIWRGLARLDGADKPGIRPDLISQAVGDRRPARSRGRPKEAESAPGSPARALEQISRIAGK